MLFSIAVLTLVPWASATPVQNIFQVLRTSPACPASPSVVSRTHELIFQALAMVIKEPNWKIKVVKESFTDRIILSRIVLIC